MKINHISPNYHFLAIESFSLVKKYMTPNPEKEDFFQPNQHQYHFSYAC